MNIKDKIKAIVFWMSVVSLTSIVGFMAYFDTIREPIDCPNSPSGTSAFLVLRTLDTESKQIKGTLLIANFTSNEDDLEVNAVTPGSDPQSVNYESVLRVSPSPTPSPSTVTATVNRPWTAIGLLYSSQSFFYPFENYVLNIQIDFEKKSVPALLNLKVINQIDEAVIVKKCVAGYSFDGSVPDPNSFNFVLKRHRFVRLTALILYSVAFVFLVFIATREETSKVLTNSLGYLAALWGVRAIIIGSVKLFPTVIDFMTLGLYVAVFSIIIYKWLFGPRTSP
jgi:hypothetical protein